MTLIISFAESLSLNKVTPASAENTILPPVIKGYSTVAGRVFAPKSWSIYDTPPINAD